MGLSQRRDFSAAKLACRSIPTRPISSYLQRKGNFLVSLTLCSLELLCTVLSPRAVLDSRLTWRKHVDVKVRKAHNLLWAYDATWGLRPKVVHWLYVSIIRPSVTFASLVWWHGCQDSWCLGNTKQNIQTLMLRVNGSDMHYSYWCYGGTYWPPSTRSCNSR